MPELRRDPVSGRWTIISTDRAARPRDFQLARRTPKGGFCPFCEGNEDKTPSEIMAYRAPGTQRNGPGWQLRVVPNKYPALRVEGDLSKRGAGVYVKMNGIGAHEVFIETPKHALSPAEFPSETLEVVLHAYRERMLDLTNDKRLLYALIFKNVGESAGASLEHTHSQLICTPIVPKRVQEEMFRCEEYESFHDRCLFCDIIEQDISISDRVVINSENFLAVMAYASRFPFETWILPKQHISHFEHTPPGMLAELAKVLREMLCRIDVSLDDPPYNYMLHTSPLSTGPVAYYHWHLEVIPRVTRVAGFEWGTGFYINPVVPEEAARYLREVTLERLQSKAANVPTAKPAG